MARIVFGDITGGINFDNLDVSALLDYDHYSVTKTSLKVYDDKQNYFQIVGKNLDAETAGGHVVDVTGTLTFAAWKIHGQPAMVVHGLHADAHDLFAAVSNGDVDGFADLVLGGNDTIIGTKFADTLWGGGGKDRIVGGHGGDDLWGNAGADTFAFASVKDSTNGAGGQDTIHGFTAKDIIELTGIDANEHQSGNNSFVYKGTDDFDGNTKHGELRYETAGSDTYVYGDTDGDGEANFTIHLTGHLALDRDNFHL
jgi:Ca2+-binding RTX toxin-like protein